VYFAVYFYMFWLLVRWLSTKGELINSSCCCCCLQAKLEPTGKRPGTMEAAAAEEAAADALMEAEASSSGSSSRGCGHSGCAGDAGASADQQQRSKQQTKQQKKQEAFSVGATADLDASYVASQRLLMMAGVKLRQHTLQRSIHLGQHGSTSR
jgi:hypothetical protein